MSRLTTLVLLHPPHSGPILKRWLALTALALTGLASVHGQEAPPVPIGYTSARQAAVRSEVVLAGTVQALRGGVVSSEISGVVTELAVREGDRVAKGAVLARLRQQNLLLELDRVKAELKEARARLNLAERRRQRADELFASGVISRQELDDTESEAEASSGRLQQAEADQAALEDDLAQSVIRAPFAGAVVAELTEVGEWVPVGGGVIELIDIGQLEVRVDVPEKIFATIAVGDPVMVRFESIDGITLEAKVSATVPRADPRTRTFPVKAKLTESDPRVGVGMLARVSFAVGALSESTIVPKDAVVIVNGNTAVYRVEPGTQQDAVEPELVNVRVGSALSSWVAVDGIRPGDQVIIRGNERLFPGGRVIPSKLDYVAPEGQP